MQPKNAESPCIEFKGNILARQFEAAHPNEKWVTDVTEFNVGGQKQWLSPIMDLFNGEIVAYATARRPLFNMIDRSGSYLFLEF